MQIVVFGPSLNVALGEPVHHAHSADCRDCRTYGPGTKHGGHYRTAEALSVDAATLEDVVVAVYDPGCFDYDPTDAEELAPYIGDIRFFPCVRLP